MIHPLALVENSEIGAGTKIWQFASVIRNARLGEGCSVGTGATIDGAWVGDGCIICHGSVMSAGTLVESGVFIGPNVVICNDRFPAAHKDDFDIELLFDGIVAVHIMDGASIGANATVLPGVIVGKRAMVAANSVCDRNVPDDFILLRDGTMRLISPERRRDRMRDVDYCHAFVGRERT